MDSDDQLLSQFLAGDERAFETLVGRYEAPLRKLVYGLVRDWALAEDVAQDAFLRAYQKAPTFRGGSSVKAWLYRIARNTITDHFRKRPLEALGATTIAERPAVTDDDGRGQELAACLGRMVGQLPEKYREAIELAELEGSTQSQVAARLGLSLSGAKSRVQRGREQLKKMLLSCCDVELDSRRRVLDYQPRGNNASRGCSSDACG